MEGIFFSKNRFLKLGPIRGVYFGLFAAFFFLTEIGREIYRPYVYRNRIDDFGLADVVGNLLGTVAIIFFNLGVIHAAKRQGIRLVAFVTFGVAVYELLQSVLPRGVLDWKDVISTFIAGLFSLAMFLAVWRVVKDPLSEQA